RRHTRFSRDWSSDVCSSDLNRELDDLLIGRDADGFDWHGPRLLGSRWRLYRLTGPNEKRAMSPQMVVTEVEADVGSIRMQLLARSEERRVGQAGRSRGGRES